MLAVVFDFDGTIADSFDYVTDFLSHEAGKGSLSPEKKQALRHLSLSDMARRLGFHWWDAPRLFFTGRRRMHHAIRHLPACAGMPALIKRLHTEGHQLYVLSTNSVQNVEHFLKINRLDKYFSRIYGDVGIFSKAPALRHLLQENSFDTNAAIYVGDELRDVKAAQSVGLKVVAVSWGFAARAMLDSSKPSALVDTPEALYSAIEKLSS